MLARLALLAAVVASLIGAASAHAQQPPIVLLILDEFPTDDLVGPDGQIDAARFPGFAALASQSTWFRNAVTTYDSTFKAVPSILDARLPKPLTSPDVRSHHRTIYHWLAGLGYEMVDVQSGTAVCPPFICPGARTRRPGILARLAGGGRPPRLHSWIGALRERPAPTFYMQHALFPHEPWLYLPSGRQSRPTGEDPIEGINKPPGFDDPDLTLHARQRHLLQVGYVDRQIGRLLTRMRRTGLLDEALLVVVADHGYSFELDAPSRREVTETNIEQIAPVPMFVKAPGQDEGAIDDAFVRNIDVMPTIADLLDVELPWRTDGASALSAQTRERDTVSLVKRNFSRTVSIDGDELVRRREENRRRWAMQFGTGTLSTVLYGNPWTSVYRIGPNQELLGRRVDPRLVPLDAAMANAELPRHVRVGDTLWPTRVTGSLPGTPRGSQRDLAVAVNGRVEAVGRSFRLGPRRPEFFSLLVPEDALRPGANDVRLYEVRP